MYLHIWIVEPHVWNMQPDGITFDLDMQPHVKMYSCMFQICGKRFKHDVAYLNRRSKSYVM